MRGDLQGAATHYRAAIDINPAAADAWICLGKLYEYTHRPELAVEAYRNLVRLDQENPDYACRLANAMNLGGDSYGALDLFGRALDLPGIYKPLLHPRQRQNVRKQSGRKFVDTVWLATSLAPGKYRHQHGAVDSWLAQGFKVLSLNTADEITALEPHFSNVEFAMAERDASAAYGKPYVYFDDVLACLESREGRFGGIINSDIYLVADGLKSYIIRHSDSSFLYGCRVDVQSMQHLDGRFFELGYDYFFFDKEILCEYPPDDFCIGLPWWDYWALFIPAVRSITLKKLTTPVAYHVTHPTNWDKRAWIDYANHLIRHLGASGNGMDNRQLAEHCANYIRAFIAHRSECIAIT
jgi:tetratricopeptide (TPR) repeat protein